MGQTNKRKFKPKLIWQDINLEHWESILNRLKPEGQWKIRGDRIHGLCPNHAESNPSFYIRPSKNHGKCYSCDWFITDPVRLISKLSKKIYPEALSFLLNDVGGRLPSVPRKAVEDAKEYSLRADLRGLLMEMFNAELVDCVQAFLLSREKDKPLTTQYQYSEDTLAYLENRGIPLDCVHMLPLGIVPLESNLQERFQKLSMERDLAPENSWLAIQEVLQPLGLSDGARTGWIVFPFCSSPTEISAFRVREPSAAGVKHIYSFFEEDRDFFGFYGLNTPSFAVGFGEDPDQKGPKEAIGVEGEFDALALIIPQVLQNDFAKIVFSFGGKVSHSLDPLKSVGIDHINLIPDWDEHSVDAVQNLLSNTTIPYTVFNASVGQRISETKDVHDVYKKFFPDAPPVDGDEDDDAQLTQILDIFLNEDNYFYPVEWVRKLATENCEGIHPDNIRARTDTILHFLNLLNTEEEKQIALKKIEEELAISLDGVEREMASDSEEAFINAIQKYVEDHYTLLYEEPGSTAINIHAWNIKRSRPRKFDMAKPQSPLSQIRNDLGPIIQWVEKKIGMPPQFQNPEDDGKKKKKLPPRHLRTRFYESIITDEVLPSMSFKENLEEKSAFNIKAPGIHVYDSKTAYVVNGRQIFKGVKQEDDTYKWELLEVPKDQTLVFRVTEPPWTSNITDVETLQNEAPQVDLETVYQQCQEVLDLGFRFNHHEYELKYLAAFMICLPLTDIFDFLPWVQLQGGTTTGKSSLSALLGGRKESLYLVEHSAGLDKWTDAGLINYAEGSTKTLLIDELENIKGHSKKAQEARNALATLRNAMSQGAIMRKSTRSGETYERRLRFPMFSSSINIFEHPQDRNRVNRIETASFGEGLEEIKKTNANTRIEEHFGAAEVEKLKRKLTLGCLGHLEAFRRAYREVRIEFMNDDVIYPGTSPRFREQLYPILTTMKLAGEDYRQFAQEYTRIKTLENQEVGLENEYSEFWNALLHTPKIKLGGNFEFAHQTFTVAQLINDPELIQHLNSSSSGVFYIPNEDLLVLFWPMLKAGDLLKGTTFQDMHTVGIQAILAKDDRTERDLEDKMPLLKRNIPGRFSVSEVTVIKAEHFKGEFSQALKVIEHDDADLREAEEDDTYEDNM